MSEVTKNNVTEDQSAASNSAEANSARESVGALLRATRIKAGKEIVTVAGSLRISMRYLEALEDGRNDDLPGATYAVGFVRSYAEYLGLDEDEIVRRFKEQVSGVSEKSELTFPKPIPEGGVPGGVLLLGGAVLALLAYGVLYLSTDGDEQIAEMVEPVPQSMSEKINKKDPSSPQEGSSISSPATTSPDNINITTKTPEPEPEPEPEQVTETPDVMPVAEEPVATPAPEETPEIQEAAEEVIEESVETVVEAAPALDPAEAPSNHVQADSTQPVEQPVAEPEPDPKPEAVAPAPTDKPTFRIVVRAKTNSWIQVRDERTEKLLFTRLLRKGNEYNVPDRDGLTLLTGNAGALEILVDGELVPSIGETGDIRRNVQLDPEQLKSGTAVKD